MEKWINLCSIFLVVQVLICTRAEIIEKKNFLICPQEKDVRYIADVTISGSIREINRNFTHADINVDEVLSGNEYFQDQKNISISITDEYHQQCDILQTGQRLVFYLNRRYTLLGTLNNLLTFKGIFAIFLKKYP